MDRLGMLGGTFDPPHIGHLIVAQDLVERLALDLLLIVPAGDPPHRDAVFPSRLRYVLALHAFDGMERVLVSDIEIRRSGPSYTVDTLEALREEYEPKELFCVIGADQLRMIETWHERQRLPELARVVVMARGDDRNVESATTRLPYDTVEVTRVDVSSTQIRARLAEGRSIRYLVPEAIRTEVEEAWRAASQREMTATSDSR